MNIAIIDDTATDRILLSTFLKRYMEENNIKSHFHIYEFESGEDFFASYSHTMFDFLFIDYYMHGMSGMDVAKKVRNADDSCAIFFTTSSPDHAIESFLVKALLRKLLCALAWQKTKAVQRAGFAKSEHWLIGRLAAGDMPMAAIGPSHQIKLQQTQLPVCRESPLCQLSFLKAP